MIAGIDGACAQARQIAAGAGFGEALAPALLAGKDARQMALFLRLGAALDQGRTEQVDRTGARQDRGAGAEILLVENDLLHKTGTAAAVLLGPGDADPAGRMHLLLPGDAFFENIAIGRHPLVGSVVDLDLGR